MKLAVASLLFTSAAAFQAPTMTFSLKGFGKKADAPKAAAPAPVTVSSSTELG